MQLQLSEEELRDTLQRAREIAVHSQTPAQREAAYEEYLRAAEEMGIPRAALLQALYERLALPAESFAPGQLVFALSHDGCWYPAEIQSIGEHAATVRFVSGGEHSCALGDLHPLSLVPGRKLQAESKDVGWCDAEVKEYKADSGKVRVTMYGWELGTDATVPLRKLRLTREIAQPPTPVERRMATLTRSALLRSGVMGGILGLVAGVLLSQWLPYLLHLIR